jgi:amino acid transporter
MADEKKRHPRFLRVKRPPRSESPPPLPESPESPVEPPPTRRERSAEERDLHTRIVVPRQARRAADEEERPDSDFELREIRYGSASRMPYLRVVPRKRMFTRVAPGQIEATLLASRPRDVLGRYVADIKRVVLGSPFATSRAIHERLTKVKAMAVIGSDPLSSSAYATQEMLVVLALAGAGALTRAIPIAAVIAVLLLIVTASYRQTVRAYPTGGGAYTVAKENLGRGTDLLAAASLMVDYVLLVSVSAAAGIAAVTSAVPDLHDFRVPLAIAVVILLTVGNLRGIRESGTLFAAPTYLFILAMATMICAGLVKVIVGDAPGSLTEAAPAREEVVATQGLTLFLVLRAFSSGSAALTGVEAIANSVPSFQPPESRNARTTLTAMAAIAVFLFVGVTFLSSRFGLVPNEDETIVSMLGRDIFGENVLYYGYQAMTAMVLFLAANTSFNAFPLLGAILSRDRLLPRQFAFRGDRLAYSNGILLLAAGASVLLVVFTGSVTRLIPLYAVGVFIPFAISQTGMVRYWLKDRGAGWRPSLAINALGGAATAVVAVIIATTKFTDGAWIAILMMAGLILLFTLIRRHYAEFDEEVRLADGVPAAPGPEAAGAPSAEHVIVPVAAIDKVTAVALQVARQRSSRVTAVHVTDDEAAAQKFRAEWEREVPDVPLLLIESPYRAFVAPMMTYLEALVRAESDSQITVVLPSIVTRHWWQRFLHNQDARMLKSELVKEPRLNVVEAQYALAGASA